MLRPPVVAGGCRVAWPDLPPHVRRTVEHLAGAPVAQATTQPGGFSPGLAARLLLTNGRRCFAKSVNATAHPIEGTFHRTEARVSAALPNSTAAPCLLGTADDGDWVSLVFEDVAGRQPAVPWRADDLTRVLDAMTTLAERLTPSPVHLPPPADPRLGGWREIIAGEGSGRLVDRLARLVPEAAGELERLVETEAGWPEAARGDTLLHFDIHAHNILLTTHPSGSAAAGGVVFVDWPHARIGAAFLDLLILLCGVATGGTDPEPLARPHPLLRGVDPGAVDAVLAALAGFWSGGAVRASGMDRRLLRLRSVQLAYGRAALRWLVRRWRCRG
jgi:hypothetical protein